MKWSLGLHDTLNPRAIPEAHSRAIVVAIWIGCNFAVIAGATWLQRPKHDLCCKTTKQWLPLIIGQLLWHRLHSSSLQFDEVQDRSLSPMCLRWGSDEVSKDNWSFVQWIRALILATPQKTGRLCLAFHLARHLSGLGRPTAVSQDRNRTAQLSASLQGLHKVIVATRKPNLAVESLLSSTGFLRCILRSVIDCKKPENWQKIASRLQDAIFHNLCAPVPLNSPIRDCKSLIAFARLLQFDHKQPYSCEELPVSINLSNSHIYGQCQLSSKCQELPPLLSSLPPTMPSELWSCKNFYTQDQGKVFLI